MRFWKFLDSNTGFHPGCEGRHSPNSWKRKRKTKERARTHLSLPSSPPPLTNLLLTPLLSIASFTITSSSCFHQIGPPFPRFRTDFVISKPVENGEYDVRARRKTLRSMNPLRDHQRQLHQIRSSFRDSGAISVIPKPILRTNLRPILRKISILAEKNKRKMSKKRVATIVIARILERSFFVKTFEWGIFFLNFFLTKIGTKKRRVNRVFFVPILWSRWTGDRPQAD
jgi:hypothetical protein